MSDEASAFKAAMAERFGVHPDCVEVDVKRGTFRIMTDNPRFGFNLIRAAGLNVPKSNRSH